MAHVYLLNYEWVKTLSKKDDGGNDELMKIGFADITKEAHTNIAQPSNLCFRNT